MSRKRIAVLFHRNDRHRDVRCYAVAFLADFWREDGHEVVFLFGTRQFVVADVVLVHVNLSVVPEAYLDFARRYPIVLNGDIRDIRKRTISYNLVSRGDEWTGPVIVKSDLNYAGYPERTLGRTWISRRFRPVRRAQRLMGRIRRRPHAFDSPDDYQMFDSPDDVPARYFADDRVVVERFLPEVENGLYHTRIYQFLGDRHVCERISARNPIVNDASTVDTERIAPEPKIVEWRQRLHLDYGKMDYVISDGNVVLLDANKTTGASNPTDPDALRAQRRERAEGLYAYFQKKR